MAQIPATPLRATGGASGLACAIGTARTNFNRPDFPEIAAVALSAAHSVLTHWLPGGERKGQEYTARNPTRCDNRAGSFSVNMHTGKWSDFATGDRGGDLIGLVAYLEGTSQGEAAKRLASFLGMADTALHVSRPGQPGQPGNSATARFSIVPVPEIETGTTGICASIPAVPVPDEAPKAPVAHPKHGKPATVWVYRDASGCELMRICRFDLCGGKEVLPLTCWREAGGVRWRWRALPAPRPLYGLDRLADQPVQTVVVCEGEKDADAAASLLPGFAVVTSSGGARAAAKADWTPLGGCRVVVWPDADEPGAAYAADVVRLAREAGASTVAVLGLAELATLRPGDLATAELPEGWGAADALAEGMDAHALKGLVEHALESDSKAGAASADGAQGLQEFFAEQSSRRPEKRRGEQPRFELIEGRRGWRSGLYAHERDGEEGDARPHWICSPLRVVANTRDAHGSDWGRLLEWKDRDGRVHRWAMPCALLAGSGEELRSVLLREGLEISTSAGGRRLLTEYVQCERPSATARAVSCTGWHGQAFVLPGVTYGDGESEPVHYQAASSEGIHLGRAGTLDSWRREVAMPCTGNSRLVLAVASAFAAPCLELVQSQGFGMHFRGGSSGGKTTALRVAASVWGPPDYMRTWRATDNALEGVAALHSDLLLCLDELGELAGKIAGQTAYMLANGAGKGRSHRDGSARPLQRWRVLFLSTGEIGLAELSAEGGARVRAGQEVRVVDIPADAGAGLGLFELVPAGQTAGAFADRLRDAAVVHHGSAGQAFVQKLAQHYAMARNALREARERLAEGLTPDDSEGQVRRVAQHFATVAAAGELATEWGLTGWVEGEAERAAATCFNAWLTGRGTAGNAEPVAMLAQVRRFLEAHGDSRFTPWDLSEDRSERATINRAGFRRATPDGHEFYVLTETFRTEICHGLDYRAVARALREAGALKSEADGATRSENLPGMGKTRCYRITPAIWETANA